MSKAAVSHHSFFQLIHGLGRVFYRLSGANAGSVLDIDEAQAVTSSVQQAPSGVSHHQQESTLMQRTTHLPYAAEPPYENPNFFSEDSWWTNSSPSALPTQVCIILLQDAVGRAVISHVGFL